MTSDPEQEKPRPDDEPEKTEEPAADEPQGHKLPTSGPPRVLPGPVGRGLRHLEHTLLNVVRRRCPGASPMHRLGRGTSGLLLFALTPDARQSVSAAWREDRQTINSSAGRIAGLLQESSPGDPARDSVEAGEGALHQAYRMLANSFDDEWGGFGGAPKFPQGHVLSFLLRYASRTGEQEALSMVTLTLERIARGGIQDQLADLEEKKKGADKQLAEYDKRLALLDKEAEKIVAEYVKQGNETKFRILQEAKAAAEKIEEQARKNIEHEFGMAKETLQVEIFERALTKAEDIIKGNITSADQDRLVDEYLEKVDIR